MSDSLRERYDTIPYRHGAVPHCHPARLGAIARLIGVPAAMPEHCRVLELGCAEGMNLLPLAERFPRAEFVGVDFSAAQIALGESARVACHLENARFVCADLRTFKPEPEAFDYIIAHGVYSWVPDEVKERLLAVITRALASDGIAYVSYNTLPGWGLLSGLREVFTAEARRESEPAAQLEHARRVATVLARCAAEQPGAYAAQLREALADMLAKPPALFFHDELAPVNDPRTFTQFTTHAARHGLQYLAEAHYATMPAEHLPAPIRAALQELDLDFLRTQQFMDVIFQRWLRSSLLTHTVPPDRAIDPRVVCECALGLRMQLASTQVSLQPGVPLRLHGQNELVLEFEEPFQKAFLAVLAHAAPGRIPFAQALARANGYLRQVRLPPGIDFTELCGVLYRLFALDALDLVLLGDGTWLQRGNPPTPSTLMRYQARAGFAVTNRWQEPIEIPLAEQQRLLGDTGDHALLERAGLLV